MTCVQVAVFVGWRERDAKEYSITATAVSWLTSSALFFRFLHKPSGRLSLSPQLLTDIGKYLTLFLYKHLNLTRGCKVLRRLCFSTHEKLIVISGVHNFKFVSLLWEVIAVQSGSLARSLHAFKCKHDDYVMLGPGGSTAGVITQSHFCGYWWAVFQWFKCP